MRILFFHFAELGGLGGVDVVILNLAKAFAQQGHPTGIVELAINRRPQRLSPDGIPIWSVTAPSYPTPRRPRSWASFLRSTWQFRTIISQFAPDVVHVHFPLGQSIPVVGAHLLPHNWRLVVTVHNSDIRVSPLEIPPIRTWQRRLFRRADWITSVSQGLLEDADRLYPGISAKAEVIFNGVGSMWFQPFGDISLAASGHPKYVLFVGRFHHVKGVDLLLRAWQQISSVFPVLELWLVGEGQERNALQTLADSLGVSSSVKFIGRKDQTDLPSLYRHAQVVVLPSRREGLPLTLLEAGACGAVCVGTKISGIPEILQEGKTGFLAEPESPESLLAAISRALSLSPADTAAIRTAAMRNVLDNFSEQRATSAYLGRFAALSVSTRTKQSSGPPSG